MLAMTVLPAACFADKAMSFRISGGLFQNFAPSAYHMQHVLFPTLKKMGIHAELGIIRPGYVPRGGGIIEVRVAPIEGGIIEPLKLTEQGNLTEVRGIALSSHLKTRRVSERMAGKCKVSLEAGALKGRVKIQTADDATALQAGAALAIYAETDSGCIIGADRAGELRRSAEEIGAYVARSLLDDLNSGATVDRWLADQLILYAGLARGVSEYRFPRMTDHIETNLWLVESILGARFEVEKNLLRIHGIGFRRG